MIDIVPAGKIHRVNHRIDRELIRIKHDLIIGAASRRIVLLCWSDNLCSAIIFQVDNRRVILRSGDNIRTDPDTDLLCRLDLLAAAITESDIDRLSPQGFS